MHTLFDYIKLETTVISKTLVNKIPQSEESGKNRFRLRNDSY